MARRRNKGEERKVARARVVSLVGQAAVAPAPDLADRYTTLARAVARRYQMPLPKQVRAAVCRGCQGYMGGSAGRTRIRAGRVIRTCLRCGRVARRPMGRTA